MFENPITNFILVGILGLLIMVLGLKLSPRLKKIFQTIGAITVHIGIFGVLYHKVSITLFISFVALVLSLFVLIDPLKISSHINRKIYRAVGFILFFTAIAFFLMYVTHFPVWLWGIPLVLFLLSLIPALKTKSAFLRFLGWMSIAVYLIFITYAIYSRFYPEKVDGKLTSWFTEAPSEVLSTLDSDQEKLMQKWNGDQTPFAEVASATAAEPITAPESNPSLEPEGPFSKSVRQADEQFLQLQEKLKDLQDRVQNLEQSNTYLKEQFQTKENR